MVALARGGGLGFPGPAAAHPPTGCLPSPLGLDDAILSAAEGHMINNYREVFGYARIRRIEGDWARVAVVPRTMTLARLLEFLRGRFTSTSISRLMRDSPRAPVALP